MAKTYINTVKYEIKLNFEIDGIVDKPDIIGAIFGQSEGLLGDEMDLKELQKNGKVGRIEIEHTTSMGRTKGTVVVPSSMDMAETSLLAAGIESVDKVGPCESKFEIVDITDTRTDKRGEIKTRAQELLKRMMDKSKPDTQMLSEELRESVRASDIIEYGPDKLPAGPGIENDKEIIIVEGRADVLNMLKNQIRNVVGMNGSNIPPTIIELSRHKEVTAFVDGDRGGILNARKLAQLVNVDFIAKAPDGKEVEELTRKEILQALKKKAPMEEEFQERKPGFVKEAYPRRMDSRENNERAWTPRPPMDRGYSNRPRENGEDSRNYSRVPRERSFSGRPQREGSYSRGPPREGGYQRGPPRDNGYSRGPPRDSRGPRGFSRPPREGSYSRPESEPPRERPRVEIPKEYVPRERPVLTPEEQQTYKPILEELKGKMSARLLDSKNTVVKEIKVKDMVDEIAKSKKKINAVVFDGVITKRLVEAAEKAGVAYVIGARKGKIEPNEKVKSAAL